nr:hypothetical protein [Schwartzia sp. (in: firmicutes)]
MTLAILASGCTTMEAPRARSFEDPPILATIHPLGEDTLVGKWVANGRMDHFDFGVRISSSSTHSELEIKKDGSCNWTEETVCEDTYGGYSGLRVGSKNRVSYSGRWNYDDSVLTMHMERQHSNASLGNRSRKYTTLAYTLKWHSLNEFSMTQTDDQFRQNCKSTGQGQGWAERAVSPNGVETLTKRYTNGQTQELIFLPFVYRRDGEVRLEFFGSESTSEPPATPHHAISDIALYQIASIGQTSDGKGLVVRVMVNDMSKTFEIDRALQPEVRRLFRNQFSTGENENRRETVRMSVENGGKSLVYTVAFE